MKSLLIATILVCLVSVVQNAGYVYNVRMVHDEFGDWILFATEGATPSDGCRIPVDYATAMIEFDANQAFDVNLKDEPMDFAKWANSNTGSIDRAQIQAAITAKAVAMPNGTGLKDYCVFNVLVEDATNQD